ncbi:hypothetical protein M2305_000074 [Gluconobacter cerinus]|nr:hypothetical protein [Gluconobacter cerinus]MCW2264127.1 hypothetical protein [Gluconobacter cerinus]
MTSLDMRHLLRGALGAGGEGLTVQIWPELLARDASFGLYCREMANRDVLQSAPKQHRRSMQVARLT